MKKIFLTSLILSFFFSCKTYSQVPQKELVLSKQEIKKHKSSYQKKIKNLGIVATPQYFYKHKINVNKISEFKSLGIDLVEMSKKIGSYNYKEMALFSPVIIEGVIIGKEYDTDINSYFHTSYEVKISSLISGSTHSKDVITIKTRSGSIGEDKYVANNNEPNYFIGEKVLLMLKPVDIEGYKKDKKNGLFYYKINAKQTDFTVNDKYTFKSNLYFDRDKKMIGKKKVVITNLKKINRVNNRVLFNRESF